MERTPCPWGSKCRSVLNEGWCENWHPKLEFKDLKERYFAKHVASKVTGFDRSQKGGAKAGGKGKSEKGKTKGKPSGSSFADHKTGCFNCGGDHYRRYCPYPDASQHSRVEGAGAEGPKPPEVSVVGEERLPREKAKAKAKAKITSGRADITHTINEEVRSLAEQIDHFKSRVDRVKNTVELSDYFEKKTLPSDRQGPSVDDRPCYSLESALDLNCADLTKAECGLGNLLDKLLILNPDFATIAELSGLGEDNFEVREY